MLTFRTPAPQVISRATVARKGCQVPSPSHHVVPWKQLLQELRLFMLDRFDDEFIVAGHIEEGTTSSRVTQFNKRFTAEGVLGQDRKKAEF